MDRRDYAVSLSWEAIRMRKRARTLIFRRCGWASSSTDEKGQFVMPKRCREKGCLGIFEKGKPIPERFSRCFTDFVNVEDLRSSTPKS